MLASTTLQWTVTEKLKYYTGTERVINKKLSFLLQENKLITPATITWLGQSCKFNGETGKPRTGYSGRSLRNKDFIGAEGVAFRKMFFIPNVSVNFSSYFKFTTITYTIFNKLFTLTHPLDQIKIIEIGNLVHTTL